MNKFKGTFSVIVTPFTEDSHKVNIDVLKKYIDWQINEGIHGIVPMCSTGDFLSLN